MNLTSAHGPALRYVSVCKRYYGRSALNNVNLTLSPESTTALVGVNGAGKSTLLRATLDLTGLDAGTIEIAGIGHRLASARTNLAYLPERFVPPHYLTGRELLQTLLRLHGVGYDESAAAEECRALDLDPSVLTQHAREYSKGMTQKLGLAACLLARRPLMILDEPLSGLDPLARRYCCERLKTEKARGTALFFSTHAFHELDGLCDRVVVMHRGQIVFDDTFAALCAEHPLRNPEQALFAIIKR